MTPDAHEVRTCKSELKIMLFTAPSRAPFKCSTFHLIQHHSNYYLIFNSSSSTFAKLKLKTLAFEILKSCSWGWGGGVVGFFFCCFITQHLHMNTTETKNKTRSMNQLLLRFTDVSMQLKEKRERSGSFFQGTHMVRLQCESSVLET